VYKRQGNNILFLIKNEFEKYIKIIIGHLKMDSKSKIWYLENFNFFSELNLDQRKFVRANTKMNTVNKAQIIYFQDDPANSVYFLKEGSIRISKFHSDGTEFMLTVLGPGEIFGESSIFGNSVRKESATAEQDSIYCVMREEKLKELLFMVPSLNLKFSEIIETRLGEMQNRLESLSFKNNNERILDFLKEKALKSAHLHNGQIIIDHPLTHEKVAMLTATSRQEVSSLFSYLKKKNVIDYDRKTMRILKFDELRMP